MAVKLFVVYCSHLILIVNASNFPKEAIEALGEGQKAKEKADKTVEAIEETSKSRKKRRIPGEF